MTTALNLTEDDYRQAAAKLNCDAAAVHAVAEVESTGNGFLDDGRPKILYEAHRFHALTGGKYASKQDRRGVALSVAKWDQSLYGRSGAWQHDRLEDAALHDWEAAHKAVSWGQFQIMGENHLASGHSTIRSFVAAMKSGAAAQLDAFASFITNKGLDHALRHHDWVAFARGYNGAGYAANKYDVKLRDAYYKWKQREEEKIV
jgi:hypothetical protein